MEHEDRVKSIDFSSLRVSDIIDGMHNNAFNARRLAEAAKIFHKMVRNDYFIFLTLSGAMIPAGMMLK